MNRRDLLKTALKSTASGIAFTAAGVSVAKEICAPLTPVQPEGPFYPRVKPTDRDADLVRLKGHTVDAEGIKVLIIGRVMAKVQDLANNAGGVCIPAAGALVDLWQACHTGKYNHPSDPNSAPLDPHFQYSAEIFTDSNGYFRLRTIIPGAYPASANWVRPPHIHLRIEKLGYNELTTQLYFDQFSELNAADLILRDLPEQEQKTLIMKQELAGPEDQDLGDVVFRYETELVLSSPRGTRA